MYACTQCTQDAEVPSTPFTQQKGQPLPGVFFGPSTDVITPDMPFYAKIAQSWALPNGSPALHEAVARSVPRRCLNLPLTVGTYGIDTPAAEGRLVCE